MLCNLIFGLIFVMIVPGSEGYEWIGTFVPQRGCNVTGCCCPSKSLVIQNTTSGKITGNVGTTGSDCPTSQDIIISDTNSSSVEVKNFAQFEMVTDNQISVIFHQTAGFLDDCKANMTRQSGGGGGGTGDKNKPSASGSKALLNHDSILIKFISILMTTIFITHI